MRNGAETLSPIVVAATFAADPLIPAVSFWGEQLNAPLMAALTPYGQAMTQLHDGSSRYRTATSGRALLLRWRDLGDVTPEEFAAAVVAADDGSPTLIAVCPEPDGAGGAATKALLALLSGSASIAVVDFSTVFADYAVAAPHDVRADEQAHVPYTIDAFAAMGGAIARWRMRSLRPPLKMIAADGDNTLWDGVLGEDGAADVLLGAGALALQRRLAAAAEDGVIVAILSKNEEADVMAALDSRTDFPLRRSHLLGSRINWRAKSENMSALLSEYGVGPESALFIDDNPIECAEMRAATPGLMVAEWPAADGARFLSHYWPLDRGAATTADLARVQTYRVEAARRTALESAPSIEGFFATLRLEVDIREAVDQDLPRIAQLCARTNQFNLTLERLDEADLHCGPDGSTLFVVSVRDRFGDYGVVGAMRARPSAATLGVDLFLLSCRALGRGVEHAMARRLAALATEQSKSEVAFAHVLGPRNTPARRFLASMSLTPLPAEGKAIIPVTTLATIEFTPRAASEIEGDREAPAAKSTASLTSSSSVYQAIAERLTTGAAIASAMDARSRRARPDLAAAYLPPSPGVETELARIWSACLGVDPIGVNDDFKELGGKSIHLVRAQGMIAERLGIEVELVTLFRFPTIVDLARHLQSPDRGAGAGDRGERMRLARSDFARRLGARGAGR